MNQEIIIFLLVILIIIIGSAGFLFIKWKRKKGLFENLKMSLFLIKMPKYEKEEEKQEKDIKSLIEMTEQIYSSFTPLKKEGLFSIKPRVALEIASETGGEDIAFYIAVSESRETSLEKIVQGVYPNAVIEKIPKDYTIFEPKGKTAGSFSRLKSASYFPLKTYNDLQGDPLSTITNSLSNISPDEGAAIQLIVRPTSSKLEKRGEKIISYLQEGKPIKEAIAKANRGTISSSLDFLVEALMSKSKKSESEKDITPKNIDEIKLKAIESKIQKPVLEANIKLVGVGQSELRAKEILEHLKGAFTQFSSSFNSLDFKNVKPRKMKKFIYDYSFRKFNPKQKFILNVEELSSIYHFPFSHLKTPNIKWAKTKEVAPPTELALKGFVLIGKTIFRKQEKPVYFASKEDRRRHFYLIGQTGTGKSSLMREMIRQDIENGEGVGVIDPHGELIEDTLAIIPKERIGDVILFEPFDMNRPCGLNMLEWDKPEQKDFAVSEMINIFTTLFPPEMIGPMFEHYMRNAMLALMANKDNPGTLVEIPRMFTDDDFMKERLRYVKDPLVRGFWEKEWAKTTGSSRSDMLGYVVSKIGRFIENEMIRNIIGQSHSSFDVPKIMNEKKILLVNLSKGLTGEINSSLLGLILVSKIQIAAMQRTNLLESEREDFYLYIDEFQNFTTKSIATILSEARKYRLNLILAHQFIPQLSDEIRDAVLGNVGTMASFRIGADDAQTLEKQFSPEFSQFDLINLDNFELIIKMIIEGQLVSPFKIGIFPPKEGNKEIVSQIKKISKLKYGRDKQLVEQEILKRLTPLETHNY